MRVVPRVCSSLNVVVKVFLFIFMLFDTVVCCKMSGHNFATMVFNIMYEKSWYLTIGR